MSAATRQDARRAAGVMDFARYGSREEGLVAARRAGRRVTHSPYSWQPPTITIGPAKYELRQLTPGVYEWVGDWR